MGFPSPARDYLEPPLDLFKQLVPDPDTTFFYTVETDCMINAYVVPGSILVVVRSATAENGDMIIVRLQGNDYLRVLRKSAHRMQLVAANSKYPVITLQEGMEAQILGVVSGVINTRKTWDHVCTR